MGWVAGWGSDYRNFSDSLSPNSSLPTEDFVFWGLDTQEFRTWTFGLRLVKISDIHIHERGCLLSEKKDIRHESAAHNVVIVVALLLSVA